MNDARTHARTQFIAGVSCAMVAIDACMDATARSRLNILITGETGVGKEAVARALHQRSPRADRPFVVFSCCGIPRDLVVSELFGADRGAFTGAHASRDGKVAMAEGGTLLLDEIGDMPLDAQPALLRFVESRSYAPLGAKERNFEGSIMAATHRDLHAAVRCGSFREDLYFRLAQRTVHVPPLRERRADVGCIVGALAQKAWSACAFAALEDHPWRGNVRELVTLIERADEALGDVVTRDALAELATLATADETTIKPNAYRTIASSVHALGPPYDRHLEAIRHDLLAIVLEELDGNTTALARQMGKSRTAVRKQLAKARAAPKSQSGGSQEPPDRLPRAT